MGGAKQPDFAEYLRARRRRQPVEPVAEYEDFLGRVDGFFRLRATAEDQWRAKPHRAYGRNGPLPLRWEEIAEVLRDGDGPPERLVTRIAADRYVDVSAIGGNLRKTLLRLRERTPLGRVQQIDVACLRWLTRQPGRTAAEKAGAAQTILGVVRRENFDTLENRVFKDFLLRAAGQCGAYLDEFGTRHKGHPTVDKVRRFRKLCLGLLEEPVFDGIRAMDRLPTPNYVLQQDRHYSKIWKDYVQLVRQETMALRLWERKAEVEEAWLKLRGEWPAWGDERTGEREGGLGFHTDPCAEYDTPLWFNVLDGRNPPLDNPCWRNRLGDHPVARDGGGPVENGLAVVDLSGDGIWRELLVKGLRENEKPHLQDFGRPNIDPAREWWTLGEILEGVRNSPRGLAERQRLKDYFEQLAAQVDAERWVVLVPDDWPASLLEQILVSIPIPRSRVFLLWRSVAACLSAIGRLEGEKQVAIIDGHADGSMLVSKLELEDCGGRLVPRRLAYRRMKGRLFRRFPETVRAEPSGSWTHPKPRRNEIPWDTQQAIRVFASDCRCWIETGQTVAPPSSTRMLDGNVALGGRLFDQLRGQGKVAYFDELEGLYLVVTRKVGYEEKPVPVALVEPDDRFPGGTEYKGPEIHDFTMKAGENSLNIYLAEGEPQPNTPLKLTSSDLEHEIQQAERLVITTRMTPGQGLAFCTFRFESGHLPKPVRIDLSKMKDPPPGEPRTLLEIEESLPRSFPPDLPLVEASPSLFWRIQPELQAYMAGRGELDGSEFAKARKKPPPPDPSPIDRLRRINVFGNAPDARLPVSADTFDFDGLFLKLAKDCGRDLETSGLVTSPFLRLIAWSYQGDCPFFAPIKGTFLRRYEDGMSIGAAGCTLLCHLFTTSKELGRLFRAVKRTIVRGMAEGRKVKQYDALICYSLLQFHPDILAHVSTPECTELMNALQWQYCMYPSNPFLRAMLFMLNRRRYDRDFYRVDWDEDHLPAWIAEPSWSKTREELRLAFIAYVCGKGTLEGLPAEDDDDG